MRPFYDLSNYISKRPAAWENTDEFFELFPDGIGPSKLLFTKLYRKDLKGVVLLERK